MLVWNQTFLAHQSSKTRRQGHRSSIFLLVKFFALSSIGTLLSPHDIGAQEDGTDASQRDAKFEIDGDQLYERPNVNGAIPLDESYFRHDHKLLQSYKPLIEPYRKSTLTVMQDGKQVALATAISSKGYLLTKASEINDALPITCRDLEGQSTHAKIADRSKVWDLAILKLENRETHPVQWSRSQPNLGSVLIANDTSSTPFSMGTLSVLPRRLKRGFLGIEMGESEKGVAIRRVLPNSAAEKAGLKPDDFIRQVDGRLVKSILELRKLIGNRLPGDNIKIHVDRELEQLVLEAELTERQSILRPNVRFGILGMEISKKRTGFPLILQHDLFVRPEQCGGPLIDLNGNAVGLNIARVDRVTSYAIPSVIMDSLLDVDEKGEIRFAIPLEDLFASLAEAQENIDIKMAELKKSMERYEELQTLIRRATERK